MAVHEDDRGAYLAGEERPALSAAERAELDELRGLLGSPATWAEPSAVLEDRVVDAIAAEAGTQPAPDRERSQPLRERRRWRPALPAYALGGLAAAAAAAVIAIVVAGGNGTSSKPPEQLAMVVSGTERAPSARGSATLTKTESGWRIQLAATGLPHLDGGRYYEAWLMSEAGVLVPVGTFDDAENVTLWAGEAPPEYPSFTVTLQRAGASAESSGERVLVGSIRVTR